MLYFVIFLAELLSLFFFSGLITKALAQLSYFFTGSHRGTVAALAVLYLPGTIVHELSHILAAGVLFVHTGEIEFIPQIREDGVKLGSAEIGITDPLRRAIIGLAPVLLGASLILGILAYLNYLITSNHASVWIYIIIFILIFELANTMFSSKKDLEGTLAVLVAIGLIVIAVYLFGFGSWFNWVGNLFTFYESFFRTASFQMLIPIGIDLAVFLLVKLLVHRKLRNY